MMLSDSHRRMLFEGSGIDPAVAAERGYYTARLRSEVPEAFKDYQRKPGLVVPMFSPDGETALAGIAAAARRRQRLLPLPPNLQGSPGPQGPPPLWLIALLVVGLVLAAVTIGFLYLFGG